MSLSRGICCEGDGRKGFGGIMYTYLPLAANHCSHYRVPVLYQTGTTGESSRQMPTDEFAV